MSGHTPGPWFKWYSAAEGTWSVQHSGGWIARVLDTEPNRPGEANAEFIVRACNAHEELLEALKGLLPRTYTGNPSRADEIAHWERERDLGNESAPFVLAAYAAIAKAEPR